MPRGRARADDGIGAPHCVQKVAGGVDRWQVGHRIWPGLGVDIAMHCARRAADAPPSAFPAAPPHAYTRRVDPAFPYRRINVVGTSASGKSTFAAALAARLDVPHIELDALHWEPDWTEAADAVMRDRVSAAIAADAWVVDGNYSATRDLVWARVEAVVWLDLPLRTILRRYLLRTARRIGRREELWGGNRERLSMHLLSRESLLWWILRTYRRRRREYPALLAARPDIAVLRLRSAAEADRWLAGLMPAQRG